MKKTKEQIEESRRKHKASNMPKRAKQQEIFSKFMERLNNAAIAAKEKHRLEKEAKLKQQTEEKQDGSSN